MLLTPYVDHVITERKGGKDISTSYKLSSYTLFKIQNLFRELLMGVNDLLNLVAAAEENTTSVVDMLRLNI